MKILFLTDNFPPEVNAPAIRTFEHCKEWKKHGADPTIITCAPNFPHGNVFKGYKNKRNNQEEFQGLKVRRVWTYIAANQGFFKRILDYISFGFSGFYRSLFVKTDVIVATSPQFFTAIGGYFSSLFKRKPWVMEVRDLWPESIAAVGALKKTGLIYKMLSKIELFLYKKANAIVVVTHSFKSYMISRGIDPEKIHVITNGVDSTKFYPVPKNEKLIKELGLEDKFVIGYLGTHGLAHKLDFILQAIKKIEDKKNIYFLFIGDGAEKNNLQQLFSQLDLANAKMLPPVKKSEIADYISLLDVALVNLKKSDTFKSVIPSKIFENAAMQKPILLGVEGESKSIIEKYNAGICFEPENEQELLDRILRLYSDKKLYSSLIEGCDELTRNFNRKVLADKIFSVLKKVAKKKIDKMEMQDNAFQSLN